MWPDSGASIQMVLYMTSNIVIFTFVLWCSGVLEWNVVICINWWSALPAVTWRFVCLHYYITCHWYFTVNVIGIVYYMLHIDGRWSTCVFPAITHRSFCLQCRMLEYVQWTLSEQFISMKLHMLPNTACVMWAYELYVVVIALSIYNRECIVLME